MMNLFNWLNRRKRKHLVLLVREDRNGRLYREWLPEPEAHEKLLYDPENGDLYVRGWIVVDDEKDMSHYGRSV